MSKASIRNVVEEALAAVSPGISAARCPRRRIYVSNGGDGSVSVIDTSSNSIVATISVGQRRRNTALTADGAKLYVANGRSGTVSVIGTAKNPKRRDVTVEKLPWGVVVH